jgi:hypothetical protein
MRSCNYDEIPQTFQRSMKLTFKYFLRIGAYTKNSKTSFKEYDIIEEGVGFHIYLRKIFDADGKDQPRTIQSLRA